MAAQPNHVIIFLMREYLHAEQARCKKHECALDVRINKNMTQLIGMGRSEYATKYTTVIDMAAEAGQWREYRIELGAILWSLDQI